MPSRVKSLLLAARTTELALESIASALFDNVDPDVVNLARMVGVALSCVFQETNPDHHE